MRTVFQETGDVSLEGMIEDLRSYIKSHLLSDIYKLIAFSLQLDESNNFHDPVFDHYFLNITYLKHGIFKVVLMHEK